MRQSWDGFLCNLGVSEDCRKLIVEVIEDLQRIIVTVLPCALDGGFHARVEEVNVIGGGHLDAVTILVSLIQGLSDSTPVIKKETTIVHKLDLTLHE